MGKKTYDPSEFSPEIFFIFTINNFILVIKNGLLKNDIPKSVGAFLNDLETKNDYQLQMTSKIQHFYLYLKKRSKLRLKMKEFLQKKCAQIW